MFNDGMACAVMIIARAIMTGYKDGFGCIGPLIDLGGGTGTMVAEIVKSHPIRTSKQPILICHIAISSRCTNGYTMTVEEWLGVAAEADYVSCAAVNGVKGTWSTSACGDVEESMDGGKSGGSTTEKGVN
ncbi:hypothetical protein LWI28_013538 [Acer negundo]|uniref:O-methyltransferase C-terminal domain-containing protein n=1 Tax=Acer negundo TaxID=4023 RepID=A0AAD5NRE2_ACENE|nr:hypothetical protein LWI28_013538 [Acer negundo]